MAQVVSDMVESMEKLRLDQLIPMQGNLKNLEKAEYDKLKKSMLEMGFSAPFFAWKDEKGRAQLLDGHQRSKVLGVLAGEGAQLPDAYPVVFIKAKNKKDAAAKLLVITSSYGRMTQEGLSDFMIDFNLDMDFLKDSVRFPELNFDYFLPEAVEAHAPLKSFNERLQDYDPSQIKSLQLVFGEDEYEKVLSLLNTVAKSLSLETHSETIMKLLEDFVEANPSAKENA
jgi:hypothetical protein